MSGKSRGRKDSKINFGKLNETVLANLKQSELFVTLFNNQKAIMEVAKAASIVGQSLCNALKEKINLDIEPYLKEELERYKQMQIVQKKMDEAKKKQPEIKTPSVTDQNEYPEQSVEIPRS